MPMVRGVSFSKGVVGYARGRVVRLAGVSVRAQVKEPCLWSDWAKWIECGQSLVLGQNIMG